MKTLATLRAAILSSQPQCDLKTIHWVVQVAATTQRKGHLSNERRLSKALRDWTAETEASKKSPSENFRIPIRKWRDARSADIKKLECRYTANISICLAAVASWTHNRKVRVHYEWVWDGEFVYIVQADECDEVKNGVDPTKLVKSQSPKKISAKTLKFRAAIEQDFQSYRKLANAKLYRELGYSPVDFYVLDVSSELDSILQYGICSPELISDLEVLTARPLVIRTDGAHIPKAKHDMLPRSDELRSASAAAAWLIGDFRKKIIELDLVHSGLCLISHHFIPASASAWCQAQPNKRRVRIESLWGIPEGIYWYAHDVFDVDTKHASAMKPIEKPYNFVVRERLRYKKRFVAPNEAGDWVVHEAASGFDWKRSIKHQDWIEEIAWTSRKIAESLNKAVVVMWFIDIPSKVSRHKVIPWFHTGWQLEGPTPTKAVPRKKSQVPKRSQYAP
ncbi:hypothetical protein VRC12_24080 [Pseudomonas poae]|uniref:hypothetical protein n=1 Tax=Pseudomonas poae TaxID=200451 RepID=UPI003D9ADFCD